MMQELADGIETRPSPETLRAVLENTGYRNDAGRGRHAGSRRAAWATWTNC